MIRFITKLLCVAAISIVIFYIFEISFKIYGIAAICLCIVLTINVRKNRQKILPQIMGLLIINTFAFVTGKLIHSGELHIDIYNIIISVIYGMLLIYFVSFKFCKRGIKSITESQKEQKLFPQQEYDLERIKKYIQDFNIIGINGTWGSGGQKGGCISNRVNGNNDLKK